MDFLSQNASKVWLVQGTLTLPTRHSEKCMVFAIKNKYHYALLIDQPSWSDSENISTVTSMEFSLDLQPQAEVKLTTYQIIVKAINQLTPKKSGDSDGISVENFQQYARQFEELVDCLLGSKNRNQCVLITFYC